MSTRQASDGEDISFELVLELWDQVVEDWALDAGECLRLLGYVGDEEGPTGSEIAGVAVRLKLLVELASILSTVLGSDAMVRGWLRTPNAHLAMATPLDRMVSSSDWVRWFIRSLSVVA
ncbi:DUF2384 domain-containing protein [Sphingomonas parva]|uniref:DUF2384 domain-containing protein n=1 Tax=Sphingomonas parva TaxID=2555898 RepID=A0A4Y8ZV18_9SPHN|nr:antitoxin Xre/MbcA/ParS toxin-binding domain-containing protein [Sphingomonas parva]TFI59754.1 DUF2384 domain-containing protein [Sphingomonas parva]